MVTVDVLGRRRGAAGAAGGLISHSKAKADLACGGEDLGLHPDSFWMDTGCRERCQPHGGGPRAETAEACVRGGIGHVDQGREQVIIGEL